MVDIHPNHAQGLERVMLVVQPTGTGKSCVAVLAPYVGNFNRVLVVAPSPKIADQLFKDMCGQNRWQQAPVPQQPMMVRLGIISPATAPFIIPQGIRVRNTAEFQHINIGIPLVVANAQQFAVHTNLDLNTVDRDKFSLIIVDEAHHYPAATWERILAHFHRARILFLTATPFHRNQFILENRLPTYVLTREEAHNNHIIRRTQHIPFGTQQDDENTQKLLLFQNIIQMLQIHDTEEPMIHQAMIIVANTDIANEMEEFYNTEVQLQEVFGPGTCRAFHGAIQNRRAISQRFDGSPPEIRILIVVGMYLEGYDNSRISVVGIHRNINVNSRVLFAQFVGRAVRIYRMRVPSRISAAVFSHVRFAQHLNYNIFDTEYEFDQVDDPVIDEVENVDREDPDV